MKEYAVDVDVTYSARVYVKAESEEEASEIADRIYKNNPYAGRGTQCYVSHEIVDVNEENEKYF
jgi:hypothetical protein